MELIHIEFYQSNKKSECFPFHHNSSFQNYKIDFFVKIVLYIIICRYRLFIYIIQHRNIVFFLFLIFLFFFMKETSIDQFCWYGYLKFSHVKTAQNTDKTF